MARKRKNKTIQSAAPGDNGVTKLTQNNNTFVRIDSIDKLWGIQVNKYKEKNLGDYEKKLTELTPFELENHAIELGISINLDRETIINELIRLFKSDFLSKNKSAGIQVIDSSINDKLHEIFGGKL